METTWSEWRPFPDPRACGLLVAPIGPGCYEVRHRRSGQLVLVGRGRNVAYRMSSLLPPGVGAGTRNNSKKWEFVGANLPDLDYRTLACVNLAEAIKCERKMLTTNAYVFQT